MSWSWSWPYNERHSELEENQLNIYVKVNKIVETVAQVKEMPKYWAVRSAEKQKQQSIRVSQLVDKQTKESTPKMAEVNKDLEGGEPDDTDIQNAGKSIKKQHLREVRSLANPPPLITMALESTCILLGEGSPLDWKDYRADTMKGNVIPSIVDFNSDNTTDVIWKTFVKTYPFNPEYNEDNDKYTKNCKTDFELGQEKFGIVFDNRMITDNPAEAKAADKALWD